MNGLKSTLFKGALIAAASAALVGAAASSASAAVVCNQWHECWHTGDAYTYPPGFGIVVHGDDWRAHHMHGWRWRDDHDGRGYWRNGVWITF
jgi:hypothetical protein